MPREVMDDNLAAIPPEGVIHRQEAVRGQDRAPRVREPVREVVQVPELVLAAAIRLVRGRNHLPVDQTQEISRLL